MRHFTLRSSRVSERIWSVNIYILNVTKKKFEIKKIKYSLYNYLVSFKPTLNVPFFIHQVKLFE